ncbi:DUF2933 domain-containing protein [Martelella alba]|uniref:DUF2933 domain-containing protein n=2 Tax=Martelella alba TaxID=2590451 RepID=A0ABY2SMN3_9HYPH|nr:DUF2933 domain-containing protein [Martelella alba]
MGQRMFGDGKGLHWLAGLAGLVGAGVLLQRSGHLSPVLSYWPYALFLLCPLMHLMHGHGNHNAHDDHGKSGH